MNTMIVEKQLFLSQGGDRVKKLGQYRFIYIYFALLFLLPPNLFHVIFPMAVGLSFPAGNLFYLSIPVWILFFAKILTSNTIIFDGFKLRSGRITIIITFFVIAINVLYYAVIHPIFLSAAFRLTPIFLAFEILSYIILSIYIVNKFNNKEDIIRFMWFIVMLGVIVSIVGFIQYILGVKWFDTYNPLTGFHYSEISDDSRLIILPCVDPNSANDYLIIPCIFSFYFMLTDEMRKKKKGFISFIIIISASFYTYTRSVFIIYPIVLFFLAYKIKRNKMILLIAVILITIISTTSTDKLMEIIEMGSIKSEIREDIADPKNFIQRVSMYIAVLDVLKDNWLLGVGLGTSDQFVAQSNALVSDKSLFESESTTLHNQFITICLDVGIFGGLAIIMLIFISLKNAYRVGKNNVKLEGVSSAFLASMIALMLFHSHNTTAMGIFYWVIFGFTFSLLNIKGNR